MKVTVCQMTAALDELDNNWNQLVEHTSQKRSDLVLLPEMTFYPWICSLKMVDPQLWKKAVESHELRIQNLSELGANIVIGTRPIIDQMSNKRYNVGYVWSKKSGIQDIHKKYYLPDEEGFWEATWYERGEKSFQIVEIEGIKIGFLICTELWFMHHAREYANQGVHILVSPRGTPQETVDKWVTGGRTAAVISGAYCLSSNQQGVASDKKTTLGGVGWITDPEGIVLGTTSEQEAFITLEIDLKYAEKSKTTYPRYVME